jgi:chromosome segregation ATPase
VSEEVLAFLRELEDTDETLSAAEADLDELAAEVERVRLRAAGLGEFLVRVPVEQERLEVQRAQAERQAAHAVQAREQAEESLGLTKLDRSDDAAAETRRAVIRTRDALRMVKRRVAELDEEAAELERAAADAIREAAELEGGARRLAAAFRERPRLVEQAASGPSPGLAGVVEWGSAARAALFVARGGLGSEREAVIRQANELGSVLLGEPLLATRPATVRRRVEELEERRP